MTNRNWPTDLSWLNDREVMNQECYLGNNLQETTDQELEMWTQDVMQDDRWRTFSR